MPGCPARTSTVPGGPGGVIPGQFFRSGGRGRGRCGFGEFLVLRVTSALSLLAGSADFLFLILTSTALTRRRHCHENFCQSNRTRCQCNIPCCRVRPDYTKLLALVPFARPSEGAEPTEACTALLARLYYGDQESAMAVRDVDRPGNERSDAHQRCGALLH